MMTMGMWNDENGEKCLTKNKNGGFAVSTLLRPAFSLAGMAKAGRNNGRIQAGTQPIL